MKRLYLFFAIIGTAFNVLAQDFTKMNFLLAKKSQKEGLQNKTIRVLVKGNPDQLRTDLSKLGGGFRYAAGDISIVDIPLKYVSLLSNKNYVKRIEARTPHLRVMSDSMRIKANVNPVYFGQPPLTRGYDGSGVVMGIIDTGIDYTNPDFQDSLTGKTRVKFLWDQNAPTAGNTPVKYAYGQEWDNAEIDAGQAGLSANVSDINHGTNTSGIAAGNGSYSPGHKYRGVAPAADLVVVALNFNASSPTVVTDAVDYIYSKAESLGEPCVINLSLGDYYGSHDGLDLQAQLINNMLTAQNGRAMVASAGNAGGEYFHLGYNLSASDTTFTWFQFTTDSLIEIWADTLNFKNAKMAIGADKNKPGFLFRGNTKFISVSDNKGIIRKDTLYNSSGNRIAVVESHTIAQGGSYDITFNVIPDSAISDYNWRLMLTGEGKFDLWNFELMSTGLPTLQTFPSMIHYKMPDTLQTLLSSFQCLDKVITVGNYTNKITYVDVQDIRVGPVPNMVPGQIQLNSSIGPTRDGRLKPDIAAPGSITLASSDLKVVAFYDTAAPTFVEQGGRYMRAGGTSASSPVVAGVAALYLQKYPSADAVAVKNAITACPITDSYTGMVPNYTWGYGKVDAFAALTACNSTSAETIRLSIYPNPFIEQSIISYDFNNFSAYLSAQLTIYNVLGKLVRTINLTDKAGQLLLYKEQLDGGCYCYKLLMDGRTIQSGKVLIL